MSSTKMAKLLDQLGIIGVASLPARPVKSETMFESPAAFRPIVTLDPWSVNYGSAVGFDEVDDESDAGRFDVDHLVETADWSAGILPQPAPLPDTIVFVDGVQRIDAWARIDDGENLLEAAFASVAVGAVVSRADGAVVRCEHTARVLAVGGRTPVGPQAVAVPGRGAMVYEIEAADEANRNAVFQAIAVRRRNLEHATVQTLLREHPLVIADGRLDFLFASTNQLAGIAKTLSQLYLKGEPRGLIARLGAGERTPLFLISDSWGSRYSWFLRLPYTRRIHHGYAGIVRLELPATPGGAPVHVADMLTHHLPRFASKPEHDPRAPQNLLPVGALERRLRHELGDARYIRRLIEDSIAAEVRA